MKLREQAYEAFTEHLLARRLLPGQFVTQRDLAALTGFPLGAIREMIPRLEAEGLVRAFAQRGLQVMGIDPRLVRDAFQLREVVETAALSLFVRRVADAELEAMRAELAAVQAAAAQGPVDATLLARAQATDWGFHDRVVEAMGNALIAGIHRVNAIRIRMMMHESVRLSAEVLPPSLGEHARILEALAVRDEAAALAALRAHLASARRRALGVEADPVSDTSNKGNVTP